MYVFLGELRFVNFSTAGHTVSMQLKFTIGNIVIIIINSP